MALLVEYKCEQTNNPSLYINLEQGNIKQIRDMNNKHMQDIKHKWEIYKQSQTREICFKVRAHLLYVPAFNTMKDFH